MSLEVPICISFRRKQEKHTKHLWHAKELNKTKF